MLNPRLINVMLSITPLHLISLYPILFTPIYINNVRLNKTPQCHVLPTVNYIALLYLSVVTALRVAGARLPRLKPHNLHDSDGISHLHFIELPDNALPNRVERGAIRHLRPARDSHGAMLCVHIRLAPLTVLIRRSCRGDCARHLALGVENGSLAISQQYLVLL